MIFISIEEALSIHDRLISLYGGLFGIRDYGLLLSALEMPKASMFGEDLHKSLFDKAAAYLFHIVHNDAFLDGNKRTGAFLALLFLRKNKCNFIYPIQEFEEMVCKVATGKFSKEKISKYLRLSQKTEKIPR